MLKILIPLPFHRMTFFVCFDFYNYSLSFTVKLSLSRWWASKEQDCLINHPTSPPPCFDLSATSSYWVLPNPSFVFTIYKLLWARKLPYQTCKKFAQKCTRLWNSVWDPCLSTRTPDLSTDFYIPRSPLDSWGCHIRECTWIQALQVKWVCYKHVWFVW